MIIWDLELTMMPQAIGILQWLIVLMVPGLLAGLSHLVMVNSYFSVNHSTY